MPALAELFQACYQPGPGRVDFASIRLHYTGADPACRALRARAFTVGSDVYFADGAFAPHTRAGLWLLAHEVAHVVQQSAGGTSGPGPGPGLGPGPVPVAAPRTSHERAADAAADAFLAGRPFTLHPTSPNRGPTAQRYMAWEHAMLGDLPPADLQALARSRPEAPEAPGRPGARPGQLRAYRELLEQLGRGADEHPGAQTVRLPTSGLVVTLGELSVLPDYLGHPREIETAPAAFMRPLIQSVRSYSVAELRRSEGQRRSFHRLPGARPYALLGALTEGAEVPVVDKLGRRCGFPPSHRYSSVLARNAGHFAPFSWYRWHSFHLMARELVAQSATASGTDREDLRRRARIYAGYADHFLQDSFAAGHLINKTLVTQWYIEWLAAAGVSYPHSDVLAAMTEARQPLLHGPAQYHREQASEPQPPWDPQALADAPPPARMAATGLLPAPEREQRAAYAAYLTMLGSATAQIASKAVHEHLNKHSLVVSSAPDGPRFRLFGDHTLLNSADGAWRAAQAAAASRRAIAELLRDGETAVSSEEILGGFPSFVERNGHLISLQEWHRTGLRDLCFGELCGRWTTRAMRQVVSRAFPHLGAPTDE